VESVRWDAFRLIARVFRYAWNKPDEYKDTIRYWPHMQSLLRELQRAPSPPSDLLEEMFRVLCDASTMAYFEQRFDEALEYSDRAESLGVINRSRHSKTRERWYHTRAFVLMHLKRYEEAKENAQRVYPECKSGPELNAAQQKHKLAGYKGCEGCVHRLNGNSEEALRCYEGALLELVPARDRHQITFEAISRAESGIARIADDWYSWRTLGGILINLAITLWGMSRREDALRMIELACKCCDEGKEASGEQSEHYWRGVAHYYKWDMYRQLGMENLDEATAKEAERSRRIATEVLRRPNPQFSCIAELTDMRRALMIETQPRTIRR
jgi:tetratricopeptide (TPR) repeat protein